MYPSDSHIALPAIICDCLTTSDRCLFVVQYHTTNRMNDVIKKIYLVNSTKTFMLVLVCAYLDTRNGVRYPGIIETNNRHVRKLGYNAVAPLNKTVRAHIMAALRSSDLFRITTDVVSMQFRYKLSCIELRYRNYGSLPNGRTDNNIIKQQYITVQLQNILLARINHLSVFKIRSVYIVL